MGNLVFQATLGGQVNLVGPNTASTFNLNVPATSSTIATLTGTETFTNKTLTAPTLTSPNITTALTLTGAAGTSGQLLTSGGSGAAPTWTTVSVSAATPTAAGTVFGKTTSSGTENCAGGYQALNVATGIKNCAFGTYSGFQISTGTLNTLVGGNSGGGMTTGSNNVVVGYQALASNTVSSLNTAVGYQAGYSHVVTSPTNAYGTYLGAFAGYAVTTGVRNTFLGNNSGGGVTTGSDNTIIGGYQGSGAPINATNSNYIVLSDGVGNVRGYFDNSGNGYFSGATVAYPGSGNTNTGIFLESDGQLSCSRSNTVVGRFNRNTSDGVLLSFARDGTDQGSISVSGGTVSYNAFAGSHWSQFSDGSKPNILRGTVLDSINELVQWANEPTTERLCKVKVSDTAGSKKVYGVFMDWDNDWTATNDMYVTAVGAFICRVNASVTVQEGDLLESNGDGTARVQVDDIIRSSTIGKVTCTEKTHQYDDGSYCVPTVLYCG